MSFHTFDLFSLARLLSLREFFTLLAAARLCSCLKSRAIYVKSVCCLGSGMASLVGNPQAKTKSCIIHRKATTYDDCRNVYVTAISSCFKQSSGFKVSSTFQRLRPYVVFNIEESATEATTTTCTEATQHKNHVVFLTADGLEGTPEPQALLSNRTFTVIYCTFSVSVKRSCIIFWHCWWNSLVSGPSVRAEQQSRHPRPSPPIWPGCPTAVGIVAVNHALRLRRPVKYL